MTPRSVREYMAALGPSYRQASRQQKGRLMGEAQRLTGYHRKSLLRLLRRPVEGASRRRGRPRHYGPAVAPALHRLWEASDRLCSKRLVPFLPTLIAALERHDALRLSAPVRVQLLTMSPATADRLLAPYRAGLKRRPYTQRSALSSLQAQIPVRTFGEWQDAAPGAVQADLVAHCGPTTAGFYLSSLLMVDVVTSWTECRAVWGQGKRYVAGAVGHLQKRLPLPLRELHVDNGGEFLNHVLYPYCQEEGIHFTRGRPYHKNDQAWAEQKNGLVVRRLVGYDRYNSKAAHQLLNQIYDQLHFYLNFFQPMRKLLAKQRHGARVTKTYDQAQTPYQRVLAAGVLDPTACERLEDQFLNLNPVALRTEIYRLLGQLWKLADGPRLQ